MRRSALPLRPEGPFPPDILGEGSLSGIDGVRAVTCPSCGARVQMAEGQYRTTCQYCGALLELPRPAPPPAVTPDRQGPRATSSEPAEASAGCRRLLLIPLLILLGTVGIGIYMASRSSSGAALSQISAALDMQHVSTPALMISSSDGRQPDALVSKIGRASGRERV